MIVAFIVIEIKEYGNLIKKDEIEQNRGAVVLWMLKVTVTRDDWSLGQNDVLINYSRLGVNRFRRINTFASAMASSSFVEWFVWNMQQAHADVHMRFADPDEMRRD